MLEYKNIIEDPTSDMIEWMEREIAEKGEYKLHLFGHHHKFVQRDNHLGMFQQVYCVDTNELFDFDE